MGAVGFDGISALHRPVVDRVALLVNRAVMSATQHREIRQRGRAAMGPVSDVMALAEADTAAREATAPVSMLERPP